MVAYVANIGQRSYRWVASLRAARYILGARDASGRARGRNLHKERSEARRFASNVRKRRKMPPQTCSQECSLRLARYAIFLAMLFALEGAAIAGALEDGKAAYERQDYASALKTLRPLAEKDNNDEAQFVLGIMYYKGQGLTQDYATSVYWLRRSADQANVAAQLTLAGVYFSGQGVGQNYAEAEYWYLKAANQSNDVAQAALDREYAIGQNVPKGFAESLQWLRRSAGQGNAGAQDELGRIYSYGLGVPWDFAEAEKWLRKAAYHGYPDAQYLLGVMYARGEYLPQNYILAHMWFDVAAARGFQEAPKSRDIVAAEMTPAQIAEAQRLAREWKPSAK